MYEIHTSITIAASEQQVFERLTDYERFFRGPKMTCRLLVEGSGCKGGLGAVREVTADGAVFTEEITAFEPPRHFEYVVRRLIDRHGKPMGFLHDRGWLDLSSNGEGAQVDWHSRFRVTMPLVGWFIERIIGTRAAGSFHKLLEQAKTDLEGVDRLTTAKY